MEWIGRAPRSASISLGGADLWSEGAQTMATTALNDIVTTIGLDLGKNVLHIIGMNARGAVVRLCYGNDCLAPN
jgi:hypothetical protein